MLTELIISVGVGRRLPPSRPQTPAQHTHRFAEQPLTDTPGQLFRCPARTPSPVYGQERATEETPPAELFEPGEILIGLRVT